MVNPLTLEFFSSVFSPVYFFNQRIMYNGVESN